MRNAVIDTICEAALKNANLWLLTGDLGYSVLEPFTECFPDRYVNVGVAEQNLMGIAAGLALSGKTVVTYSIANFTTFRCLEQIRNDIVHHDADVKIIGVGAGFSYGAQGHTHYGTEDLSAMRSLRGIDIITPADPAEARLAAAAMLDHPGPAYMRLGRAGEPVLYPSPQRVDRGKSIVCREGDDVLILASGSVLSEALGAAETLASHDISCAVWSVPWVQPLDSAAIFNAGKSFPLIVTVEESEPNGGLASAVACLLATLDSPRARLLIAGASDHRHGASISQKAARAANSLDADGLAALLKQALGS